MSTFEVIVGNIGNVLETTSLDEAIEKFNIYVDQVKEGSSRAESTVVIFEDGEPLHNYDFHLTWDNEEVDQLSDDVDSQPITIDEEGNRIKQMFLGTFGYNDADIAYLDRLWEALEDTDMFAERGPDPCDVFVGKVIE